LRATAAAAAALGPLERVALGAAINPATLAAIQEARSVGNVLAGLDMKRLALGDAAATGLKVGALYDAIAPALENRGLAAGALSNLALGSMPKLPDFGAAISDQRVGKWRADLFDAAPPIQGMVAEAMGRAIADSSLRHYDKTLGIAQELVERAGLTALGEWSDGIAARLRAAFEPFERDIARRIFESIAPVTSLAAQGFSGEWEAASKREREYRQALWELGWWFPPSISMSTFWQIGKMAHEGDRHGVRRAMNELSHSDEFLRHAKREWFELPVFHERARFLRDGFEDHRKGRYRVSIPMLLPHLEGIAVAAFAPASTVTSPTKTLEAAVLDTDAVMGDALVEAVTVLWSKTDFAQLRATARGLNRHGILHGRSTGYGTAANSTKLLFALDLLASFVEDAERAKPKTPDGGD
jgi:hypothetical protein